MFSKKLNFDIVEKNPKTYYVIKDPNQPPYAITVTKKEAIDYILPYADAYLNLELGLIKDPIGRHDHHNDYYSYITYDGTWYSLHKLIKGDLKKFRHPTLDGLLNQFEKQTSTLKESTNYCISDITTSYQLRQIAAILRSCIYPVFLTDNENLIEDITAKQQKYLENKTNYDLSIDMTETNDGYSFEPTINGEIIDKDSLKAIVTENVNNQLTEINHHLKHVKKAIESSLKDIPTK